LQRDLGIAFVYVTHSQSEAFAMADRVVIMNDGKICQIGTPKEIYRKPASRFVAEFVGLNNLLTGRLADIQDDLLTIDTPGGLFVVQANPDSLPQIGDAITFVVAADSLRPVVDATPDQNQISCTIISEEFVGATVVLLLEQPTGEDLKIQLTQREFDALNLKRQDQIRLSFDPSDTHLI